MALNGTRNRKAATPVSEQVVSFLTNSPTDYRQQEQQMLLKRWDELRMFHQLAQLIVSALLTSKALWQQ